MLRFLTWVFMQEDFKRLNTTLFLTTDPVPIQYQHAGIIII